MKVLSVKQPWAYLLVSGIKDIENSPRRTHFRGRILIHASAKEEPIKTGSPIFELFQNQNMLSEMVTNFHKGVFINSAIIGSVEIIDCVENHPSIWAVEGQYHYVIANPILFDTPITGVKGQLGLWNYEFDENTYECTNKNSYRHQSCGEREGCIQKCDECDYYKSIYE